MVDWFLLDDFLGLDGGSSGTTWGDTILRVALIAAAAYIVAQVV